MTEITTLQAVKLTSTFTRALDGQPAQVIGVPTWASSDVAVATVNDAADGLSTEVLSVAIGSATITLNARVKASDTDAEEDVQGTYVVEVIAVGGGLVKVLITAGEPYDKSVGPGLRAGMQPQRPVTKTSHVPPPTQRR